MFEGLVSQLLVGYLGRYVKDIQKEKLKITLWNEEVLLENVELILEAFDYLQLPFGLKEGRVGRLSIKIPWKKLGREPIIISLENVYICASQRDDNEWSMESVERRDFSAKKSKLAAAELAKLSRHVCDDHAGQSFISFITTKVLDSIQVSIKKFHVVFYDMTANSGQIRFGLKFSSLVIVNQIPVGSSSGWVRGSHVHKIVEILGLEIYCSTVQASGKTAIDSSWDSKLWNNGSSQIKHYDSILAPCNVSLSLSVSKIGKLDNSTPQYSINAELTNLVISLDEVQLQNILVLWDSLYICRLRDKYGPFRPWVCPLSKKMEGWQTLWWQYAQQSVLSDVRKKLKKTSWRYLGQRLTCRRRYITLYKNKLELLRQDQSIDEHILQELELMEKESDIDDILRYRSLAESQIQYLFNSTTFGMGGAQLVTVEKSRIDERTTGKSRGWLNWLSRGMLGAGGTDDSSQFSGVVSDEVIKDIWEATKFHPSVSANVVAVGGGKICLCAVKFDIHHISAKLWSRKQVQVMEILFTGTIIECIFKEESGSVNFLINSAEIVNPSNQTVILLIRKPIIEKSIDEEGSCSFQVVLLQNYDVGLSVKVILEPLEFSLDKKFVLHVMEFFGALKSYKLQHDRVLSSINGIENDKARLLSKAEYVLSSHKKVTWDVSFVNITINVPWRHAVFQHYSLVLQLETLHLMSKDIWDILSPTVTEQSFVPKHIDDTVSCDIPLAFQLQDLYDQFELKINDLEMAMMTPFNSQKVSILDKFSASIAVGHCLISDESLLKQFKVFVLASSLCAHMSPSIYVAVLDLIENSLAKTEYENATLKGSNNLVSAFSVGAIIQSVSLRLGLENDGDNSSTLMLALEEFEMRYTYKELQVCWISTKAATITVHPPNREADFRILYSCSNEHQDDINNKNVSCNGDMSTIKESCFLLLFEYNNIDAVPYQCTLYLSNADIHCYPYVIGLLVGFYDSLSSKSVSSNDDNSKPLTFLGFQKFGFSNFFESDSTDCSNIPCSHFPFVTIINSGFLGNLESSLIYGGIDWRKQLHVRDRKISSSKSGLRKGSNMCVGQCAFESSMEADIESESSRSHSVCCFINFNIYGMKVHFHDSSCIVGALTLPMCKSSLLFNKNYMDLLCSVEGLILTSSWWTDNCQEILWGPSVPYLSPILNVRVRKESTGPFSSQIEVNIGIQHVYCILPPEYLAIIIGYFKLSDWIPSNEQFVNRRPIYSDSEKKTAVAYKFEILDSILLLPVEKNKLQFLKFELKQLYCSFILGSSLNDALRDIPSEYLVLPHKIEDLNDCFNIFGRDLCLSFLLFKDEGFGCLMIDQGPDCQDTILIASLSADIWVRIPSEQESTSKSSFSTASIMTKIENCEVTADDFSVLHGFEAILNSINQFASVEEQSKCFKSDVLQFLQLKGSQSAGSTVSSTVSRSIFTEVTCRFDSMVIKARQSREKELIFKVDLQLTCSALLKDDYILRLNSTFSSLLLYSLPSSMLLVRCTSTSIITPVFSISLVRSEEGNHDLYVCAPSVDVWLHLSEWTAVVNLLNSYYAQLSKTSMDKSLENFAMESIDSLKDTSYSSSDRATVNKLPDPLALVVRSEDIGINFHIPFSLKEEYKEIQLDGTEEKSNPNISSNVVEGNYFRFVLVNVHSKNSEIFVSGKNVWLKFDMDRFSGVILINKDESSQSWPFFKILKSSSKAEISNNPMNLKLEIQCDRIDVCLSHNIFCFWHDFQFKFPEARSAQTIFYCIELEIKLRKISFLLSDGRWSSCGSLLDILLENVLLHANVLEDNVEGFISSDFHFNYCNIQKAFWESFVEPWHFEISVIRKLENSTLLNSSVVNEISLTSSSQLNLNLTESLIECLARTTEMIKDACGLIESQRVLNSPISDIRSSGRHAPYIIQNLTSLPLLYHVHQGLLHLDEFDLSEFKGENVQPGASIPIYVNESVEEQFFHRRSTYSSGCLSEQKTNRVGHHYISIQLDGTSVPSSPISMDLVGHTYFEVNFSKPSSEELDMPGDALRCIKVNTEHRTNISRGFTVPVVFDVSVHRYSKLIRLYSTVILFNTTSMPLELRFDIPLSVLPKILDPLRPGEEFPLPLHLAEAGRIRFRPMGNSYLWSEAYNLSNLLSDESKIGLRSIVCYPSNRTSDSFRCCISVRNTILPLCTQKYIKIKGDLKESVAVDRQVMHDLVQSKKQFIHQVTLSTPLIVKNYLPKEIEMTVDTGGIADMKILSEVETFFHHMDPSHDLVLELHMEGFKPSSLKFPRAETFCSMAKFVGTKFSLSETITLISDLANDSLYITLEKTMDAYSGARELGIFVPFVLYNCTGISFFISESGGELNRSGFLVPSCYDISEPSIIDKRDGLNILSSSNDSHYKALDTRSFFSAKNEISARDNARSHSGRILLKSLILTSFLANEKSNKEVSECQNTSRYSSNSSLQRHAKDCKSVGFEHGKVKPCMYSPNFISSSNEVMVRACNSTPEYGKQKVTSSSWSSPFYLIPPSGSTTVLVPQSTPNAAYVISVTAAGTFSGMTNAITFQPRFIISNACSKHLCYKQKGTEVVFHLSRGEHSHLQWTDTIRELLVSVRYNEPGWQWSGGFLPDHLGDTQIKTRNYVTGALNIIRVEVQNADISVEDEKIVGSLNGNSATNLILLSDDDTGYVPYRIDNFSKERLRIYQQSCESFETIVHSYTSCPYAWDEPYCPHRLNVEVPGEQFLGSYALDDVKEYMSVRLSSTGEKPERILHLSVHAEGATKVLSIIDSSYHTLNDMKIPSISHLQEKKKHGEKPEKLVDYKDKFSIFIPYIGVSLINSYPEELVFACARNITVNMLQSLDRQKFSLKILSLQIDNQLRDTPYPVILCFDHENKNDSVGIMKKSNATTRSERILQMAYDKSFESVFCLTVSKWRKTEVSLISFEHINLRIADFRIEIEQQVILRLFEFFKKVVSKLQSKMSPFSDHFVPPLFYDTNVYNEFLANGPACEYFGTSEEHVQFFKVPSFNEFHRDSLSLPSIVPIGAPWQQIYLLARRQKKVYVESFDVAPIKLTLSFSSAPWTLHNRVLTSGELFLHRGLMALGDIEGARIRLKQLSISHHMASWESVQEILSRHYTRQLLHEIYKVFGSAGVIGNPMGFARSLGVGIRDFLSEPAKSIFQSPTGFFTGMAHGTSSLLSNTVYAISDAATQFSKSAQKGIVAFTFDDHAVTRVGKQQIGASTPSEGVINEVLEGLTGLLQSPIRGAEKHGLPGVFSGIALGITGLVAKPAASILQVTGKTAQSIRNRTTLYKTGQQRFRTRLPRPLSRDLPLRPFTWEEAVGASVLLDAGDGFKLKDEVLVICKALKQAGKFVVITETLILVVSSSSLVDLGKPEFRGIGLDVEWVVDSEVGLESIIHVDADDSIVHIVGSSSDVLSKQNQNLPKGVGGMRTARWNGPTRLPLFQTNLELTCKEEAEFLLQVLLSTIESTKQRGWGGGYVLHQHSIK